MKSSAFSITLYPVPGYTSSFQRTQLLLTGTSPGHRHRAYVWMCMCVCMHTHQSGASVTWNPRSWHRCGKSPWPVTHGSGPGAGTWRGLQLPLPLPPPQLPARSSPPNPSHSRFPGGRAWCNYRVSAASL